MTSITCIRGDGLTVGETVVEPILSDSVLVHRGTHEINNSSEQRTYVTLNIVYRSDLKLGDLVSISDPNSITAYRGKVIGIKTTLEHGNAGLSLTIERVL